MGARHLGPAARLRFDRMEAIADDQPDLRQEAVQMR
jgi:hypothetical protein